MNATNRNELQWREVMLTPAIAYMFIEEEKLRNMPFHWYRRKGLSGFQCGLGWKYIVLETLKNLASKDPDERFRIAQIKEKFGKLRIYIDILEYDHEVPEDVELWEVKNSILNTAEIVSGQVCEQCARPGKIRPAKWLKCECIFHHMWYKYVNNYTNRTKINRVKAWCKNHLRLRKRK